MEENIFLVSSDLAENVGDMTNVPEEDNDIRREYEELIRTRYKKFYTEDTQRIINKRFKKYKELEERAERLEEERTQFENMLMAEKQKVIEETEQRILSGIRTRLMRPDENGIQTAKIQERRDVSTLTRSERADMARRASSGETIKI